MKRVSMLVGGIILAVIALVAFGGVFVYQQYATQKVNQLVVWVPLTKTQNKNIEPQTTQVPIEKPTPQQTVPLSFTIDPSTGKKIYTNTQYGFSFQFPDKLNSDYIRLNSLPSVAVTLKGDNTIASDGCYPAPNEGTTSPDSQITINNMQFCLSSAGGGYAGGSGSEYYYTTLKNNNYYTLEFLITRDNCGNYDDGTATMGSEHQACVSDENNYDTIVMKPIQASVATLKFTK